MGAFKHPQTDGGGRDVGNTPAGGVGRLLRASVFFFFCCKDGCFFVNKKTRAFFLFTKLCDFFFYFFLQNGEDDSGSDTLGAQQELIRILIPLARRGAELQAAQRRWAKTIQGVIDPAAPLALLLYSLRGDEKYASFLHAVGEAAGDLEKLVLCEPENGSLHQDLGVLLAERFGELQEVLDREQVCTLQLLAADAPPSLEGAFEIQNVQTGLMAALAHDKQSWTERIVAATGRPAWLRALHLIRAGRCQSAFEALENAGNRWFDHVIAQRMEALARMRVAVEQEAVRTGAYAGGLEITEQLLLIGRKQAELVEIDRGYFHDAVEMVITDHQRRLASAVKQVCGGEYHAPAPPENTAAPQIVTEPLAPKGARKQPRRRAPAPREAKLLAAVTVVTMSGDEDGDRGKKRRRRVSEPRQPKVEIPAKFEPAEAAFHDAVFGDFVNVKTEFSTSPRGLTAAEFALSHDLHPENDTSWFFSDDD